MGGLRYGRRRRVSLRLTTALASAALVIFPAAPGWADDVTATGGGSGGAGSEQAEPASKRPVPADDLVAQAQTGNGAGGAAGGAGAGGGIGATGVAVAGLAVVGVAGVAAAAMGGGSDSGETAAPSSTPAANPEVYVDPATPEAIAAFRTAEYLRHGGYDRVNLAHAYARGYTGAGQLIAILDDGFQLDHPEIAGRVATTFPGANDMPIEEHGTHVAGIAAGTRDGTGMHGAAFGARLALYGFDYSPLMAIDRFNRASSEGAVVINNSWGFDDLTTDVQAAIADGASTSDALANVVGNGTAADWNGFLNAMVDAQEAGAVIVFAASNFPSIGSIDISAGMPLVDSRLLGRWLTVVNVDSNDQVTSIGCGEARAFCIAAPGENIVSALPIDRLGALSGTSMASPLVSGAVALVVEAFGLSPEEAVNRLLTTADRAFAAYDVDEHGQGILDMDTATRPIGRLRVQSEGSVHRAAGPDLAATSLLTSRAFGDSVSRAFDGMPIAAFDDGGAAFLFDMGSLVSDQDPAMTSLDTLHALGVRSDRRHVALPGLGSLSLTMRPVTGQVHRSTAADRYASAFSGSVTDGTDDPFASLMAAEVEAEMPIGRVQAGFHRSADTLVNRLSIGAATDTFSYSPGLFAAPYPGFAQEGYSLGFDLPLGETTTFSLLSFTGEGGDGTPFDGYGTQASVSMQPLDRLSLTVDGGALIENDTLMGTGAEGAFSLGGGARTVYAGARAEAHLDDNWSLVGSYHRGWTAMDGFASSLIRSVDGVETQSFAAGIVGQDLVSGNDRFGFAVSQPIRVESGRASFDIPTWRDWSGAVLSTRTDVDLAPSGRELRFEATYGFDLASEGRVTALAMHRFDADHVAGRQDTAAMIRLQQRF